MATKLFSLKLKKKIKQTPSREAYLLFKSSIWIHIKLNLKIIKLNYNCDEWKKARLR